MIGGAIGPAQLARISMISGADWSWRITSAGADIAAVYPALCGRVPAMEYATARAIKVGKPAEVGA